MPPSTEEPVINAANLTKSYGLFRALRGVDLEVRRGEIFGFLGPNGAGKTTFIRCLLDLIRPDGGSLRVLGIDPQKQPVEVRRRCGYLPGELRLDDSVRVRSVLRFFRSLRGGDTAMRGRANEIAERLQLATDAKIKNLSKGNKQKVGIVAAFMHRPDLLLLDEPTSGLDPLVQQTVLELVREACTDGATVFFSSHVLAEVQAIADRVAIIRAGEVVEAGHTAELTAGGMIDVRLRIVEGEPTPTAVQLEAIPGVSVGGAEADGRGFDLHVDGAMDRLVKFLAAYHLESFETRRPSLEEVFLAHYDSNARQEEGGER